MPVEIKDPRQRRKQVKDAWDRIEGKRVDQLSVEELRILLAGIAYLTEITDRDLKIKPIVEIIRDQDKLS